MAVAPLVGAWIETSRVRQQFTQERIVAPLVGAWIETRQLATYPVERDVAPLVGAWIETKAGYKSIPARIKSHPSWVRGLKLL